MRAARWMGVAPWELEGMSAAWRNYALAAEMAENKAESERMKHRSKK